MIREYEDIIDELTIASDIITNSKLTIKHVDADSDYQAIEIYCNQYIKIELINLILKQIKSKYNDLISEIFTVLDGELYLIYLNPIDSIRGLKIGKLKKRMAYGI